MIIQTFLKNPKNKMRFINLKFNKFNKIQKIMLIIKKMSLYNMIIKNLI